LKQYGIYIRRGKAQPYMIHFYDTIEGAKLKLYDMITTEEERCRPYFVDNDFFNNKYVCNFNVTYYCIKERDVTEFINYSEENSKEEINNNIVFFNDYKNIYNY